MTKSGLSDSPNRYSHIEVGHFSSIVMKMGRGQQASPVNWKWHIQKCSKPSSNAILALYEKVTALSLEETLSPTILPEAKSLAV